MSAYKKGEELLLRPYYAIIRAKMGFQRDNVHLAGVWGQRPQEKPSCRSVFRGNPSLGFPLFDCSAIKFTLSCVLEGGGIPPTAVGGKGLCPFEPRDFLKKIE